MSVTRRDLLTTVLGASVAQAACTKPRVTRDIPGCLVDQFLQRGHLLRQPMPSASGDNVQQVDVAIVGAGVAGLSAAWRLRNAGLQVKVFELDDVCGGTARSGHNAIGAFPWGAHYLPAPLRAQGPVTRLLTEMGVMTGIDEQGQPEYLESALVQDPEERLFYKGLWYEGLYLRAGASADDLAQLARFNQMMQTFAAAKDSKGRKAFEVPLELGSDDAEFTQLDKLSMAQWLESNGFTSPRLTWMVDYGCRDDYGGTAAHISAYAGIWYFAARQSGEERNEGFLSWPEGNGKLVAHLLGTLPPETLARNTVVHTVTPSMLGGGEVDCLETLTLKPLRFLARQVIVACPQYVAAHIIQPWRVSPPAFLKAFTYSPWVVANVSVSQSPAGRGFPLAWDNVLYQSKSLGYVSSAHQSSRAQHWGPNVLTWYYPVCEDDNVMARKRLLSTSFEDWRDVVVSDLSHAHRDIARTIESIEVLRWGHAMVRPSPNFLFGAERPAAQAAIAEAIHFAHSDLGGMALFETANWHGVRAAEAVLARLGRASSSWL